MQQPLPFLFLASTPRPVVAPPYSTSFAGRGRCWRAPSAAGAPSRASFAGRRSAALEFCRSGTPLASVALELRRSRALLASPAGRRTRALQELTGGVAVAELLGGACAGKVRRRGRLALGQWSPPGGAHSRSRRAAVGEQRRGSSRRPAQLWNGAANRFRGERRRICGSRLVGQAKCYCLWVFRSRQFLTCKNIVMTHF